MTDRPRLWYVDTGAHLEGPFASRREALSYAEERAEVFGVRSDILVSNGFRDPARLERDVSVEVTEG